MLNLTGDLCSVFCDGLGETDPRHHNVSINLSVWPTFVPHMMMMLLYETSSVRKIYLPPLDCNHKSAIGAGRCFLCCKLRVIRDASMYKWQYSYSKTLPVGASWYNNNANLRIILGMVSSSERRRCNITTSLIGWAHTQNYTCNLRFVWKAYTWECAFILSAFRLGAKWSTLRTCGRG